jgi:hypothetical protein
LSPVFRARNTSLGVATFRPDGLISVTGSGAVNTIEVLCTGAHLVLSADVSSGGSVAVGAVGSSAIGVDQAIPVTSSVSDSVVEFEGGATFASMVGKKVTLTFKMKAASVFAYGFSA